MMGETVGDSLYDYDTDALRRALEAQPARLSGDARGPEGPGDPTPTLSGNATAPGVTVPSLSPISPSSPSTRWSPSVPWALPSGVSATALGPIVVAPEAAASLAATNAAWVVTTDASAGVVTIGRRPNV